MEYKQLSRVHTVTSNVPVLF